MTFSLQDQATIDGHALLRGGLPLKKTPQLYAASLLTEASHPIELADMALFAAIPEGDWTDAQVLTERFNISAARLREHAARGLLVSDSEDPEESRLRQKDDAIRQIPWSNYSRLSHFMTKWSDDFLQEAGRRREEENFPASFHEYEQIFGPAPPAVVETGDASRAVSLPLIRKRQALFRLLAKRKTTRSFDRRRRLSLHDLSVVLYYCFGCHGYRKMSDTLTVLKKTSPSGGALHPIDIYPLVIKAEGVKPGAYHYDVSRHALSPVKQLSNAEAQEIALQVVSEQEGLAGAHVIFMFVARFERHFWKYRNHAKAYKVLAMDAAHLSQTLYLVAAQLGLGAFMTGAINDKRIESLLSIDGVREGVIAVCGCGVRVSDDAREFNETPFVPGEKGLTN